jgi:hypothetical protein
MKTTRIEGWLFDVDEFGSSVALWVYDTGGKLHRLTHEFSPPVYAGGAKEELKRLAADLYRRGFITGGRWDARIAELERGEVDVRRLIVEQVLGRNIEDFKVNTRAAIAARKFRDAGIPIHPGEKVGYVITDAKAKDKERRITIGSEGGAVRYDVDEYVKRLREAGREVCQFL